jgi:RNA polymerase sigma factor for flagellar operon FliA
VDEWRPEEILTVAELRVVQAHSRGLRHADIAAEFGLSRETVKSHLSRSYRKTGARTPVALALWFLRISPLPPLPEQAPSIGRAEAKKKTSPIPRNPKPHPARAPRAPRAPRERRQRRKVEIVREKPALTPQEQLLADGMNAVEKAARIVVRRLPPNLSLFEDLKSEGFLALVKYMHRYDPSRGVPFKSFVLTRARGAMLDYLRHLDPVSRARRKELKLSGESGPAIISLDSLLSNDDGNGENAELVSRMVAVGPSPERIAIRNEACDHMHRALDTLRSDPAIQYAAEQFFIAERTQADIAKEVGIHPSRVSQRVSLALIQMRRDLSVNHFSALAV